MVQDFDLLSAKLSQLLDSFMWFFPELTLIVAVFIFLITDLFFHKSFNSTKQYVYQLILLLTLIITGYFLLKQWEWVRINEAGYFFLNMLHIDSLGIFFKTLFCISGLLSLGLINREKTSLQSKEKGEFYILFTGILLGSFLMVMGANLLMIFLSVELVSLSSYLITYFSFNRKGTEASLKYLLFGALASGMMLYGMSLLYGFTGTLEINSLEFTKGLITAPSAPVMLAGLLTIGGFLFKIGVFPFHMWAPDVYEGAPLPVVSFFSIVPKVAGLSLLIRILGIYENTSIIFVDMKVDWQLILSVIAVITFTIGNLGALLQENAKRMMAWSSIAHGGFLLTGVMAYSEFGISGILFYSGIYALMNFGAFLLIGYLSHISGKENIKEFSGMGEKYPFIGVLVIIVMVALTGLPPTAGFTAKFLVFSSVWDTYQLSGNKVLLLLLLAGLFNTVIALFYYLKIPFYMFLRKDENRLVNNYKKLSFLDNFLACVLIIPLIILFLKSDWLLNLINNIKFAF